MVRMCRGCIFYPENGSFKMQNFFKTCADENVRRFDLEPSECYRRAEGNHRGLGAIANYPGLRGAQMGIAAMQHSGNCRKPRVCGQASRSGACGWTLRRSRPGSRK